MAKRTQTGTALTGMILEVFRLNGALLSAGDVLTKPHGLTSARWQVMGAIHEDDRPLTVAQIARRMGLARQGVQRIVNDLQALNMVIFEENIDHQRAKLVRLTAKGRKSMDLVGQAQATWVNQLSTELTERQVNQAVKTMRSISDQLSVRGE